MWRSKGRLAAGLAALLLAGPGLAAELPEVAWPPPVVPDEEGAPALSAEESMKTIVVPPGYRVELVAKEPLVQDPILLDFDPDGRMWVVEMPAFAMDATMSDSREPMCRVVVLEDVDDDGTADRRTVFADGLVLPRAIKTLADGVLVGEPPNLWLMRDRDGDLKVDEKEQLSDSFGRRGGNPEHNANSLIWGLDNWLFTSEHDWHLRFREGRFEVMPTLTRGQWGGSIDDAGRVYRNVNNGPLFVDLVAARYFVRNPNVVRTRGLYEPLISLEEAVAWPIRPTRGVNRGYRDHLFRPDGSSTILQSAATPVVFRGDRLPEELRGGVFVTDSTTNLLHWFMVDDDGTGRLRARNGFAKGEIFASRDERLRPVSAASAPDGTLYVVDMYRGVVQDVAYQTEYLQDYIRRHGLVMPIGRGRIWRIVHETTVRDRRPALSRETPAGLVGYLSHPNGWWRDTAQQLLVQRGDVSVVPALEELAREATGLADAAPRPGDSRRPGPARGRDPRASPRPRVARRARLGDPVVGAMALPAGPPAGPRRCCGWWTTRAGPSVGSWQRRWASFRRRSGPGRLRTLLARYGDDPVTVDAVVSGLHGLEETVLDGLLARGATPDRSDAVAMLAGAVARSGAAAAVQALLDRAADTDRPGWQRVALLRGVDLGLGGGPEGPGRRRGGGPGRLALPREPRSLTRLAAGSDELAAVARGVVARLDWPGRTAPARRAAPADAGRDRPLRGGARGLREPVRGLPPARRGGRGAGPEPRRIAPGDGSRRHPDPCRPGWKGGRRGVDAAAQHPERRGDRRGPDLRPPGVGQRRLRRAARGREGDPWPDRGPDPTLDPRGALRGPPVRA